MRDVDCVCLIVCVSFVEAHIKLQIVFQGVNVATAVLNYLTMQECQYCVEIEACVEALDIMGLSCWNWKPKALQIELSTILRFTVCAYITGCCV